MLCPLWNGINFPFPRHLVQLRMKIMRINCKRKRSIERKLRETLTLDRALSLYSSSRHMVTFLVFIRVCFSIMMKFTELITTEESTANAKLNDSKFCPLT